MCKQILVLITVSAFSAFAANTWYVATNGVDAAEGGSEAHPFLTLQYAHDKASAGDTIRVTPGNYDKGYGLAASHNHTNRLCVSKELHFVSTVPKAAHIVGAFDPNTGADGPAAIRSILVTDKGYGTTFTDFTIRNGASNPAGSDSTSTSSSSIGNGGGLLVFGSRSTAKTANIFKVYMVDCVISNCVSKWGGALHGGTAIRCYLAHNTGTSFGQTACAAALWNSIIYDNINRDDRPAIGNNCRVVNCTIVGSKNGMARYGYVWNSIFSEIASTELNGAGAADDAPVTASNCLWKSDCVHPLVNPLLGDWRVIEGITGADKGLTSDLTNQITLPEGTAWTDFAGKPIDTAQTYCTVGAVQERATDASGVLGVSKGTIVNGVPAPRSAYLRTTGDYPQFFTLKPASSNFMRWRRSLSFDGSSFHYLDYEGKGVLAPPPFTNQICSLDEMTYGHAYWCDPTADAATADGTKEHPYRTIQAAVNAGKAQYDTDGKIFIINCLPGVYAEGKHLDVGKHNNRILIPDECPCLIRSTQGATVTTIKGEADAEAPYPQYYPGCGTNAVRCVRVMGSASGHCALQGFTFADGHSSYTDYNTDIEADRVGGVYGKITSPACQILDSVITNCTAVRGGAAYYCLLRRCQVYDCAAYGGVFRYGYLVSSYVDTTCRLGSAPTGASPNNVIGTREKTLFVTYLGTSQFNGNSDSFNYCSLWGYVYCPSVPQYGTAYTPYWKSLSSAGAYGAVSGKMYMADATTFGISALYTVSPALQQLEYPVRGTPQWGLFASNLYAFADSDLYARVPQIKNGRLPVGCNFNPVDSILVPTQMGLKTSGATADANGIIAVSSPDFTVDVSVDSTYNRPCVGFTANGKTNLFASVPSYTITYADVVNTDGIILQSILSPHWYVNSDPAIGNDANDGFLPRTAKRTLAAVMAVAGVASGDTVHAAAGSYDSGKNAWENNGKTWFRAAIPSGVTLVSDEGAEKTFIVGAPDTTETADVNYAGFGSNAIHGVYLNANSTLRGFTVTGGYSDIYYSTLTNYSSDWVVPVGGGGVCGNLSGRDNKACIYDCIISNNYAYTGGGVRFLNAINCRIIGNHAVTQAGNTRECNLWGCFINRGYQGTSAFHAGAYSITRNAYCTFGPDNWTFNGSIANYTLRDGSSKIASLSNCVVLGTCGAAGNITNCCYNTIFARGRGSFPTNDTCYVATDGMPGLFDAEGRPLMGCPALDRGDRENLVSWLKGIDTDLTGMQRIYNGQIDVGAFEGDWRARYREDIGTRFIVETASEDVVESANRTVLVNAGAAITATVSTSAVGRKYVLRFRVPTGGEAVIRAGDRETVYTTTGDQEAIFTPTVGTPLDITVESRLGTIELYAYRSKARSTIYLR